MKNYFLLIFIITYLSETWKSFDIYNKNHQIINSM